MGPDGSRDVEGLESANGSRSGGKEAPWRRHPLLAGMPPTDDPRVLAARDRLFRALDDALAAYSEEVLALTGGGGGGRGGDE